MILREGLGYSDKVCVDMNGGTDMVCGVAGSGSVLLIIQTNVVVWL